MTESFEQGMKIFRENLAGMYDNGHMTKWADVDTSVDLDRLQRAHDHEIEAEYARGHEDGRRSMDAEHAAVALRLRALPLDGDTTENLSQIAKAVWHSDFGWTQGACKALRDELVRLLGGVSERPYTTSIYDVLGNERHKAVCRLRYIRDCLKDDSTCNSLNIADAIGAKLDVGDHLHESICDRLIYLLGGDVGARHNDDEASPNDGPSLSITNELRECVETARKSHDRCISEAELLEIADRIDGQFNLVYAQQETVLQSTIADLTAERDELQRELEYTKKSLDGMREQREHWADEAIEMFRAFFPHDEYCMPNSPSKMVIPKINEMQKKLDELEKFDHDTSLAAFGDDNDELRNLLSRAAKLLDNAEQDRDANYANWMDCKAKVVQANTTIDGLQAKLDEAEFAIANWREREKSFDSSERLREELRKENDGLRERLEATEEVASRTAVKLDIAEARLRDAQAKLDVLERNGLTLMHRTLKNMLGEAKNVHDVLCAKVDAMPSFDRERKRLMRVAENSEKRCSELLDLLGDAAKEFKMLMDEKDAHANEREGREP